MCDRDAVQLNPLVCINRPKKNMNTNTMHTTYVYVYLRVRLKVLRGFHTPIIDFDVERKLRDFDITCHGPRAKNTVSGQCTRTWATSKTLRLSHSRFLAQTAVERVRRHSGQKDIRIRPDRRISLVIVQTSDKVEINRDVNSRKRIGVVVQ